MPTNDAALVSMDLSIHRGDTESFDVTLPNRDLTGRHVYFTGKANKNLDTARLFDLSSQVAGELTFVFNDPDTVVTLPFLPEYTEDLQIETVVIDIESVDQFDVDDVETEADGSMSIVFDVRTEFDNFLLPDEPVTFQQVDASSFEVDSLIHVQDVGGQRTMVEVTIAELKTILGIT